MGSARLPQLDGSRIIRALKKCGAEVVPGRGKGSHTWLTLYGRPTCVMDRQHAPSEVATILKQLGLDQDVFLKAL